MTLPDADEKLTMELPDDISHDRIGQEKNEIFQTLDFACHHDIGETIQAMIMQSFDENRLICGVFDCAQQLEKDADHVMMCFLPDVAAEEVPVRIQHTLIEAFCRENTVPVVKISTGTKFISLLANKDMKLNTQNNATGGHTHAPLERKSSNTRDYNCFLVKRPEVLSSTEEHVKSFCEKQPQDARYIIKVPS